MGKTITVESIRHDELGDKITLEVSPDYLKVVIGRKTYYFDKEKGTFDGTSYQVAN